MNNDEAGDDDSPDTSASQPASSWDVVEEILRSGFFDGMVRRLKAAFDQLPVEAIEDAVYEAAVKCAQLTEQPKNARAWLYSVAKHRLLDHVRRKPTEPYDSERAARAPSAEELALQDNAYKDVIRHVSSWPTSKMRTVVEIVLEAAHLGEHLGSEELAIQAGQVLGEVLSLASARTLKSRGMERLRGELPTIFPEDFKKED